MAAKDKTNNDLRIITPELLAIGMHFEKETPA